MLYPNVCDSCDAEMGLFTAKEGASCIRVNTIGLL